jgi:hypothetical protein
VLLANFDSHNNHTVTLGGDGAGFRGSTLWSVVHGVSGAWDEPYARRKSTQETLTMEPLAVYLAFLPTKPSKTGDSASAVRVALKNDDSMDSPSVTTASSV